jgi:hypothetical protein
MRSPPPPSLFRIFICLLLRYLHQLTLRFLGACAKIAKNDHWFRHICLSVRPHGTTSLPLDGFSCKLIMGNFSQIFGLKSKVIKTRQKISGALHEDIRKFLIISI